jgi:hypothetical protein
VAKSFSCNTPEAGLEPATRYVEPIADMPEVPTSHGDARIRRLRRNPEARPNSTPGQRSHNVARLVDAIVGHLAHRYAAGAA